MPGRFDSAATAATPSPLAAPPPPTVPHLQPLQAAATLATMADYRIRGYMRFNRLLTGGTQCTNNFITACGAQGPWLLRAAPAALKIEGPASAVAPFNGTLIGCPEAILDVSSDSSGKNYQGDGSFRADSVSPKLVPATAILLLPGGNPNTLQMRTLTSQCIYEFTVS